MSATAVFLVHQSSVAAEPILGLTALERSLLGLYHTGVKQFVLVAPDGSDVPPLPEAVRPAVEVVRRAPGETDLTVIRRLRPVADRLIVLDSDVVVSARDAAAVASTAVPADGMVEVEGGLLRVIAASALLGAAPDASLDALARSLEATGRLSKMSAVLLVRRHNDRLARRAIEDLLLRGLRKPLDVDGVVGYYVQRPVTTRITRHLARTRVSPNHLTALALLAGVASGAFVATGDRLMTAVGGALFFLGSFLDCLDGEMARLKFQFSRLGEWLDTITDDASTLSFLTGMSINLAHRHESALIGWLGAVTVAAFVLGSAYVYWRIATVYHSGDVSRFRYSFMKEDSGQSTGIMRLLVFVVKRDFFSALFFACAAVGFIEPAFAFAVIGALGFALGVAVTAFSLARPRGRPVPAPVRLERS